MFFIIYFIFNLVFGSILNEEGARLCSSLVTNKVLIGVRYFLKDYKNGGFKNLKNNVSESWTFNQTTINN